jgi:hypothetical protein
VIRFVIRLIRFVIRQPGPACRQGLLRCDRVPHRRESADFLHNCGGEFRRLGMRRSQPVFGPANSLTIPVD